MIRPLGARVLVRPVVRDTSDALIVEANPADPVEADVLAVGEPACAFCDGPARAGIEPGARVVLRPGCIMHVVTVQDETFWVVPLAEVVAEVLPLVTHG